MSKSCLIVTCGFFGDIAFASSIAKKLKDENQFEVVDYIIGFGQMKRLLENNPYIDGVNRYMKENIKRHPWNRNIGDIDKEKYKDYTKFDLQPLNFQEPPSLEYQTLCGIKNPSAEYKLYTEKDYDIIAKKQIDELREETNKKILAVMLNWEERSFLFTKDQYDIAIDVPNLGYGGKHRNISTIISKLESNFKLIGVGMPSGTSQHSTTNIPDEDQKSILYECSLMKYCDAFIGAEGGLCNLAAGVGTRTIITGDFVHQLYGPKGSQKQIHDPKLGPKYYFPNRKPPHITLDPYLTDEEVYLSIESIML